MGRPRLRPRRLLLLLLLVLLLAVLLELNRFLPGGWPGGGGGGFRPREVAGEDPLRVRPPEVPTPTWPANGVRLRVRGPAGELVTRFDVLLGPGSGVRTSSTGDGLVTLGSVRVLDTGFRVELDGVEQRFGPLAGAGPLAGSRNAVWEVHRPSGLVAPDVARAVAAPSRTWRIAVLDASTGRPLAPTRARVVTADGDAFDLSLPPAGRTEPLRFLWPVALASGALLEVGAAGHAVDRVRLEGLGGEVRLAPGRRVRLDVHGAGSAAAVQGGTVAFLPPATDGAPAPAEGVEVVHAFDGAEVVVPRGVRVRVGVRTDEGGVGVADLEPGTDDAQVTVAVTGAAPVPVVGRVVREDGRGVDGAEVVVAWEASRLPFQVTARADAHGVFTVAGVPADRPLEVSAGAPGLTWEATLVPAGRRDVGTLAVATAHALELVVSAPDGSPLGGVRVRTTAVEGSPDLPRPGATPVTSDLEGRVRVDGLRDRDYRVQLSLPGWREQVLPALRPGAALHFVTLVPQDAIGSGGGASDAR